MPLFNTQTIQRFFEQGERIISDEKPFLFDRISINIQPAVNMYVIPDYVKSIRRVSYKGWKLDPLPGRNFREVFQSATQQGTPFWYIYNNIGQNKIQLFPAPAETLQATADVWNINGSDDFMNACIIEFARISDATSFYIPLQLRRQILKYFTAQQCYLMDGSGQNLKLSKYMGDRWKSVINDFYSWLDELHTKPRKLIVNEIVSSNYFPASPVLPINKFGIGVDEGM